MNESDKALPMKDYFDEFQCEIQKLSNHEYAYMHLGQEAGAVVYKSNGHYDLYEIPMYGGEERHVTSSDNPKELVDIVRKWT